MAMFSKEHRRTFGVLQTQKTSEWNVRTKHSRNETQAHCGENLHDAT
jgi:hypothetical protein